MQAYRPATLLKRHPNTGVFLTVIAKFLRTAILKNICERLLLRVFPFMLVCRQPTTLLKKRLWHRCFPVNFAKFLGTHFLQNTSGWLLPNIVFMIKLNLVTTLKQFMQPQVDLFQDNKTLGQSLSLFPWINFEILMYKLL